jgi:uncharacterized protein (TIGR02145 family)
MNSISAKPKLERLGIFALIVGILLAQSCSLHDPETTSGIIDETETFITGTVVDPDGKPVAGARVMLHGDSLGSTSASLAKVSERNSEGTLETLSDKNGDYRFAGHFRSKAYLEVDLNDSLGFLDSIDFSTGKAFERENDVLKGKGSLTVQTLDLDSGAVIWIPQIGTSLFVSGDGKSLIIMAPPGNLTIIIINGNDRQPLPLPVVIEEKESTTVDPAKELEQTSSANQMTDLRDGRKYRTVAIGNQIWMAENLNYGIMDTSKSKLQSGNQKYCYQNDSTNCNNEGGLYQWHQAMNLPGSCSTTGCSAQIQVPSHQGICPDGWQMPSKADWDFLGTTLGGASTAGFSMKLNTTGDASFDATLYNDGNSSGFSAFPAGIRYFNGTFAYHAGDVRSSATIWEATEESSTNYMNAWRRVVNNEGTELARLYNHAKQDAFSVRCLKTLVGTSSQATSSSVTPSSSSVIPPSSSVTTPSSSSQLVASSSSTLTANTMRDSRDNQIYATVKIGTQVWMAENLNYGTMDTSSSTLQSGDQKSCYQNLEANCDTEGGLYQWHQAMNLPGSCSTTGCSAQINLPNHQGLCPTGWHMPSKTDWDLLGTTLGGAATAGFSMKLNNTGDASYDAAIYNDGNSSGFSAFPAGIRYFNGTFAYHGGEVRSSATIWEATEESSTYYMNAWRRVVNNEGTELARLYNHAKRDAFSVRCVQD